MHVLVHRSAELHLEQAEQHLPDRLRSDGNSRVRFRCWQLYWFNVLLCLCSDPNHYTSRCTHICEIDPCDAQCLLKPANVNVAPMEGVFWLNLTWFDIDGTFYNETHEFRKEDIIKLQAPIKLVYDASTQMLSWTNDLAVRSHSHTHHLWKHRVVVRQYDKIIGVEELNYADAYNLSSFNLKPNTEYNISVQIKAINKRNPYWSDVVHQTQRRRRFSEISVKMPKTIPSEPPKVTTGAFEVSVGKLGTNRTVKLYWADVAEEDWNDDQISYVIDYGELGSTLVQTTDNISSNYYRFQELLVDVDYEFRIYSQNELGRSRNYSRLVVARQRNLLPRVSNVGVVQRLLKGDNFIDIGISEKHKMFEEDEILWLGPQNLETIGHTTSYTIFWCREAVTSPGTCDGGITWKADVTQNTTITLPPQHYHFGVSINGRDGLSSGIEWAEPSCVVRSYRDQNTRSRLRLELLQIEHNWLQLGITDICLSHRQVLIHNFVIRYCAMIHHKMTDCHERKLADPWLDQVRLDGLMPLREYHISVAALADRTQEPLSNSSIIAFPGHELAASRTLVHSIKTNGANNFTVLITSMAKTRSKANYFKLTYQHQSFNCSIATACKDDRAKREVNIEHDEDVQKPKQMTCWCEAYFEREPAFDEIRLSACAHSPDQPDHCWTESPTITVRGGGDTKSRLWEWILVPVLVVMAIVLIMLLTYLRIKHLRELKEKAKAFRIPTLANRNLSLAELDGMLNNDDNLYGVYGDELNGLVGNGRAAAPRGIDASFGGVHENFQRNGSAGSKSSKTALLDTTSTTTVYQNHDRHVYEGASGGGHRGNRASINKPTELQTFKIDEPPYNNIDGHNGWKPPEALPLKMTSPTSPPPTTTIMKTANVTGSYVSPDALMSMKTAAVMAAAHTNGHIGLNGTNVQHSTMV